MDDFKVIRYNKEHKDSWDFFVDEAKNATFLFKRDFMEYHQDRFEDFSLIIYKKNKIVALLPANKEDEIVCSHRGLTYGGILIKPNLNFTNYVNCFQHILKFLYENNIVQLDLKLIPSIYSTSVAEEHLAILHLLEASIYKRELALTVPLTDNYQFSKSRTAGVKIALKNKITITESNSLDEFWNELLVPVLAKKHQAKPTHSLEEMRKLKSKFPKNIRQFYTYFEGNIIGGTTIFETKNVAHTQYIANHEDFNHKGGSDFLFHYLMTEIFKEKKYFDFGSSTIPNSTKINKGLFHWKQGFGAIPTVQDIASIKTNSYSKLDKIFK